MSSRINPELAKRYNNPDIVKYEQKRLNKEKANVVLRSKAAKVRPPQKVASPNNKYVDKREYMYNKKSPRMKSPGANGPRKGSPGPVEPRKGSPKMRSPRMQKFISHASDSATKTNKAELKKDINLRKNRRMHKDCDYVVPKSPIRELQHEEEEKIEIVFEEVEDDEDLKQFCRTDVSLDDFRVRRMIDKGSFGEVFLAEYLVDGKKYAMKRIKKAILTDSSLKQSTENEKGILMNLNHPFLLTMTYLIENDKRYYFFLEYIPGGNMYKNMYKVKRFEEEAVKFYVAQLALGLGYLHEKGLVHRDLKLENILLDKDGYIKLCDFGLAKLLGCSDDITYTYCGTTEYLAPEILYKTGHGFAVDWWTLGKIFIFMH